MQRLICMDVGRDCSTRSLGYQDEIRGTMQKRQYVVREGKGITLSQTKRQTEVQRNLEGIAERRDSEPHKQKTEN